MPMSFPLTVAPPTGMRMLLVLLLLVIRIAFREIKWICLDGRPAFGVRGSAVAVSGDIHNCGGSNGGSASSHSQAEHILIIKSAYGVQRILYIHVWAAPGGRAINNIYDWCWNYYK